MSKAFYARLALTNIKKNSKTYLPYILTCIGVVAMFYMIGSLANNPGVGEGNVSAVLKMTVWVTGFFAIIFIFYTNSFLMKRRKKEFGLYNILGMEKRHLGRVILCETLFMALVSIVGGMALGMLLDKAMYLLLLSILNYEVQMGFQIQPDTIVATLVLFCGIFFLIFLNSLRQVYSAKPIELLKGGNVGEREPKTKWIMSILGVICLGGGYYLAVTTKSPIMAIPVFFIAVLLVIAGTYLIFTSGSIALLKILRKNKGYYYKTKHFISVSGMMYRMKQNAVGLANICVLSTVVLVMISSTLALYIGMEDIMETRYPQEFAFYTGDLSAKNLAEMHDLVNTKTAQNSLAPKNEIAYTYHAVSVIKKGNLLDVLRADDTILTVDNSVIVCFVTLDDYNKMAGKTEELADGEVIVASNREKFTENDMQIFDMTFTIKQRVGDFIKNGIVGANIESTYFFVMKDADIIETICEKERAATDRGACPQKYYYGFDLDASGTEIMAVFNGMFDELGNGSQFVGRIECKEDSKKDFLGLYGGLFFIGIFLGILFIMATILIMYYKQVSEGYDDRERFEIMQKVGMSKHEIKQSIHSQVLTVFFLPLVTAAVHIAFAFPVITKLLAMLNLTNVPLFALCTVGSLGVFAVLYALVYGLTAKIYYKLVS